jgi:hypothetical protein
MLKHRRAIQIDAYAREDGLWDIDAQISDVKTRDAALASGLRSAGAPLHNLLLRVTIDTHFNVIAADAASDAVPYPGYCDTIGPAYAKLTGLNLMRGFRKSMQDVLGGVLGCTHITELAQLIPTAALQAFAGDVFDPHGQPGEAGDEQKPFQLDNCHALRTDGLAVAKYYPRWAVRQTVKSEPS